MDGAAGNLKLFLNGENPYPAQLVHDPPLHDEHEEPPPPATTPLSPWAQKRDSARLVWPLPQSGQGIGSSAALMARRVSKRFPQSLQVYS
jgi:hypothetical protein